LPLHYKLTNQEKWRPRSTSSVPACLVINQVPWAVVFQVSIKFHSNNILCLVYVLPPYPYW
jgi:hypothetical protein